MNPSYTPVIVLKLSFKIPSRCKIGRRAGNAVLSAEGISRQLYVQLNIYQTCTQSRTKYERLHNIRQVKRLSLHHRSTSLSLYLAYLEFFFPLCPLALTSFTMPAYSTTQKRDIRSFIETTNVKESAAVKVRVYPTSVPLVKLQSTGDDVVLRPAEPMLADREP